MGQAVCGKGTGAKVERTTAKSHDAEKEKSGALVLPQQRDYLGRCWLLASSPASFSPSRWFPLSARTLRGERPSDKRAFLISASILSAKQRKMDSFLTENHVTVHNGVLTTPCFNMAVACYSLTEVRKRRSVCVGGVPIDTESALGNAESVAPSSTEKAAVLIVAVRRAEVELEPAQYEVRGYKRYEVPACLDDESTRESYGEGCVTAIQYGGWLAVMCDSDCSAALKHLIAERMERYDVKSLHVDGSQGTGGAEAEAKNISVQLCGRCAASDRGMGSCAPEVTRVFNSSLPATASLHAIAAAMVDLYCSSSLWAPTALFLQRYEAIGDCLLRA